MLELNTSRALPQLDNGNRPALDQASFTVLFEQHRPRLWQLLRFRMSAPLRRRIDIDDVLQEVYLAGRARLRHFQSCESLSFFPWLRIVALQTLQSLQRFHFGTGKRSLDAEENWTLIEDGVEQSPQFVASITSPSQHAVRQEMVAIVKAAMHDLSESDLEIIVLRHFEELTNEETSEVLGVSPKASSIRYIRALDRLRHLTTRKSS